MSSDTRQLRFHGYRLDPVRRVLTTPDGTDAALAGRAFDVLALLIRERPRVIGKDELLAAVWPGRVVEENNLTQAISVLRRALGTGGGDHQFILTVPGRGYSFVAEVTYDDESDLPPALEDTGRPPRSPRRWRLPLAIATLLLLALAGVLLLGPGAGRAGPPAPASLAVLPFRAIDNETADPMLEMGMAETLITRLSRATRLRVLALGTTQALGQADPLKSGIALGVDFVVDGHVQRSGHMVRVTARLLAVPDGRAVWAETMDAAPERVFEMQDSLASHLAAALAQRYALAGYSSPCDGADAAAHRAYVRGRYLLNRPNPRTLDTALASFEQAIARDPGCARAWAGVAATRRTMVMVADRDPEVEFPRSDAAIDRALAIDPSCAEAYAARGFNQFWYHWDWAASEASLRRAIALDPNLVEAHFALAHLLNNLGRHDEALLEARRASALDPLSPLVNTLVVWFVGMADHADEARARLAKVVELEPDFWIALSSEAAQRMQAGDKDGALRLMQRAVEVTGGNSRSLLYLGTLHAASGDTAGARAIMATLEARARHGYVLPSTLASMHMMLGEKAQALDLLEEGYRHHDLGLAFLSSWFAGLAGEPRYRALLARMHLPPPPATAGP